MRFQPWLCGLLTFAGVIALSFSLYAGNIESPGAVSTDSPIDILTMDGPIGPAFATYLESGIARAQQDGAQAVIIELNTPGGLLSTTREMITAIVESPVPVVIWVTPSGAHAASAGTFLMYAAHIAAMDEGTNIGAATPVEMRGQIDDKRNATQNFPDPNTKAMNQKAVEDTAALIRGLAVMRGRNADWAEKAVKDAVSLTAGEALKKNVIDLISPSRTNLLMSLNGRTVKLKDGSTKTLATTNATVRDFPPDWKTRLMSFITDPNVAFLLMSIGVYGIILEFYHPGTMIPGTIGAISLILGLYALNVMPINAAGAALIVLGLVFMVAEALVPAFGILGIAGVAAFIFGSVIMFDTESMPGLSLDPSLVASMALAGIIIVGLVAFVTLRAYKKHTTTGAEGMIGTKAKIVEWDGRVGRVSIQGELWKAETDMVLNLSPGDDVTVTGLHDLILKVKT